MTIKVKNDRKGAIVLLIMNNNIDKTISDSISQDNNFSMIFIFFSISINLILKLL